MVNVVQTYKDLIVWQKSMDLVVDIYKLTDVFPQSELYGITSQMRRCSVSIPSNIAEGRLRRSKADYKRFLSMAYSSGAELETQIEISKRLKFTGLTNFEKVDSLLLEVMKMLNKIINNSL